MEHVVRGSIDKIIKSITCTANMHYTAHETLKMMKSWGPAKKPAPSSFQYVQGGRESYPRSRRTDGQNTISCIIRYISNPQINDFTIKAIMN